MQLSERSAHVLGWTVGITGSAAVGWLIATGPETTPVRAAVLLVLIFLVGWSWRDIQASMQQRRLQEKVQRDVQEIFRHLVALAPWTRRELRDVQTSLSEKLGWPVGPPDEIGTAEEELERIRRQAGQDDGARR